MKKVHLVFDGYPGPKGCKFIEAEDDSGKSINVGEWLPREDGLTELVLEARLPDKLAPTIVICGSSRFVDLMAICAWILERDENAITMGLHLLPWWYGTGAPPTHHLAEHENVAEHMDKLHLRKIDVADEIFVVNPEAYIGDSTSQEIAYAATHGKLIRLLSTEDNIQRQIAAMMRLNNLGPAFFRNRIQRIDSSDQTS